MTDTGVAAAVGDLIDEAGALVLQPSLFPSDQLAGLAKIDGEVLKTRAPGRPPGSMNQRTRAFRDYILARHHGGHPVDGMIEAYQRPVHALAAELGCTKLEALRVQLDCRRIVLEYVEGKMPVSVNVNSQTGIAVIFEAFTGAQTAAGESEYFQQLTVDAAPDVTSDTITSKE
jgi:hypothetical protein